MKAHTHLPSMEEHYSQLLGLVTPWTVRDVALDIERMTLDIHVVEGSDASFPCPECAMPSPLHDHAPERRWRHLDTMQFTTEIVTRLPRVSCGVHGVKTVAVPWADAHARWTLLFESFAIAVLQSTSNLTDRVKQRPFMDAWTQASNAPIVHDSFHVSKYLGEAVNAVRKQENRALRNEGNDLVVGAKYLFLKNNLKEEEKARFRSLMQEDLKVGRAWALKEDFRHFSGLRA